MRNLVCLLLVLAAWNAEPSCEDENRTLHLDSQFAGIDGEGNEIQAYVHRGTLRVLVTIDALEGEHKPSSKAVSDFLERARGTFDSVVVTWEKATPNPHAMGHGALNAPPDMAVLNAGRRMNRGSINGAAQFTGIGRLLHRFGFTERESEPQASLGDPIRYEVVFTRRQLRR